MDEEFWPEDEEDGAPAPRPGVGSVSSAQPRGTPRAASRTPRPDGAWPGPEQAAEAGSGPMAAALNAQPARPAQPALPAPPPTAPPSAAAPTQPTSSDPEPALDEPAIYAPPAADAATARAGVPVALPQRVKPNLPTQYVPPMPQDLPQAPESAWAQPPSSQYPMVGRGEAADVEALPRPQIQPLHGVPHQVPPAPMPRPVSPAAPSPPSSAASPSSPAFGAASASSGFPADGPGFAEPPAYWPQPPAEEPVYHYEADLEPTASPEMPPSPAYSPSSEYLPAPDFSPPPEISPTGYSPAPEFSPAGPPDVESGWTPDHPPQEPYRLGPHQQPGPAVRPITAEEFARRRTERRPEPQAERGFRGGLRKSTFGLITLPPGRREQEYLADVDLVRRNFGGLRQITVVNPKGGAGKTVAVLMLAMTFGQRRGGYVLAWDNNETQGTLGMRAQQDFHSRTVRDLLRDLHLFQGSQGRVGDLSHYVRGQGEGMFEVLASDESATAGEMLTEVAFGDIRDVVSRFYKIIVVDTGNNVRAPNWQAAVDATDQLVVTMSARNDSAETAARMLDHLEQTGRVRTVRNAVTVISMPQSQRELDVPSIERHFASRTRAVLRVPYERIIDTGEPIAYTRLSASTADAWLKVAAAVAAGL
ncbi:MAG: chromosome partitioning protein [Hamadaea sp.]|nr:chromosome partitioning protein [Hamadaea sp.]